MKAKERRYIEKALCNGYEAPEDVIVALEEIERKQEERDEELRRREIRHERDKA